GDTLSSIASEHDVKGGWDKLFKLNDDIVEVRRPAVVRVAARR
ncbi:LysM domain-containing protein, partial [Streptomyces sp. NPDC007000]